MDQQRRVRGRSPQRFPQFSDPRDRLPFRDRDERREGPLPTWQERDEPPNQRFFRDDRDLTPRGSMPLDYAYYQAAPTRDTFYHERNPRESYDRAEYQSGRQGEGFNRDFYQDPRQREFRDARGFQEQNSQYGAPPAPPIQRDYQPPFQTFEPGPRSNQGQRYQSRSPARGGKRPAKNRGGKNSNRRQDRHKNPFAKPQGQRAKPRPEGLTRPVVPVPPVAAIIEIPAMPEELPQPKVSNTTETLAQDSKEASVELVAAEPETKVVIQPKDRPIRPKPRQVPYFNHYARVLVQGQKWERALVDSKNMDHSAISGRLWRQLSPFFKTLIDIEGMTITTADEKQPWEVLGQLKHPITWRIGPHTIQVKPFVIEAFTNDISISQVFLKTLQWTFDQQNNCIWDHLNQAIPLTSKRGIPRGSPGNEKACVVYTAKKAVIPGWHQGKTVLRTDVRLAKSKQGCMIMGEEMFVSLSDLMPPVRAVTQVDTNGECTVLILNTTNATITVSAGVRFGTAVMLHKTTKGQHQGLHEVHDYPYGEDQVGLTIPNSRPQLENRKWNLGDTMSHQDWMAQPDFDKKTWLVQALRLTEKKAIDNTIKMEAILSVCLQHFAVFPQNGQVGSSKFRPPQTRDEDRAGSPSGSYQPLSPHLKPTMRVQTNKWLRENEEEASTLAWAPQQILVWTKEGHWQSCTDYRTLAQEMEQDTMPMPTREEVQGGVAGSLLFSSFENAGHSHPIVCEMEERFETTFDTPWRSKYHRCPLVGSITGPTAYDRVLDMVIRGVPLDIIMPFTGHEINHSIGFAQQLQQLSATLQTYTRHGAKISHEQCNIFEDKIDFIGTCIDATGLRPGQKYKETVYDQKMPTNKTEIRAWTALMVHHCSTIENFAAGIQPWTEHLGRNHDELADVEQSLGKGRVQLPYREKIQEMRQKDMEATIQVSRAMETAFFDTTQAILHAPDRGVPYFKGLLSGQMVLQTHFGDGRIYATLAQEQPYEKIIIGQGSANLIGAQRQYNDFKGQLFAAHFYFRHFAYYLKGEDFEWRINETITRQLKAMKEMPPAIAKWSETIKAFSYQVAHTGVAGQDQAWEEPQPQLEVESPSQALPELGNMKVPEPEGQVPRLEDFGFTKEDIIQYQDQDLDLDLLKKFVTADKAIPEKEQKKMSRYGVNYALMIRNVIIGQDGLLRIAITEKGADLVRYPCILPDFLIDTFIKRAHQGLREGASHKTEAQALTMLTSLVHCCHLQSMVQFATATCGQCHQEGMNAPAARKEALEPAPAPSASVEMPVQEREEKRKTLPKVPRKMATPEVTPEKKARKTMPEKAEKASPKKPLKKVKTEPVERRSRVGQTKDKLPRKGEPSKTRRPPTKRPPPVESLPNARPKRSNTKKLVAGITTETIDLTVSPADTGSDLDPSLLLEDEPDPTLEGSHFDRTKYKYERKEVHLNPGVDAPGTSQVTKPPYKVPLIVKSKELPSMLAAQVVRQARQAQKPAAPAIQELWLQYEPGHQEPVPSPSDELEIDIGPEAERAVEAQMEPQTVTLAKRETNCNEAGARVPLPVPHPLASASGPMILEVPLGRRPTDKYSLAVLGKRSRRSDTDNA